MLKIVILTCDSISSLDLFNDSWVQDALYLQLNEAHSSSITLRKQPNPTVVLGRYVIRVPFCLKVRRVRYVLQITRFSAKGRGSDIRGYRNSDPISRSLLPLMYSEMAGSSENSTFKLWLMINGVCYIKNLTEDFPLVISIRIIPSAQHKEFPLQ